MATILIVDDLAANRDYLVTLLRYQGHRVLEATDGSEGLRVARSEHPDLVVTDVLMPVMDGYELVRELRLDPATRSIPVVFHTAHYAEREARALAQSSGVAHVLTKPAEPEEVLEIIAGILSGALEAEPAPADPIEAGDFDRDHLRLVTDKLSEKVGDLRTANMRLRALINVGLELASERDAGRLLASVCTSARELFGATYVTLGIVEREDRTIRHLVGSDAEAAAWSGPGDSVSGIFERVVSERLTLRAYHEEGGATELQLPPRHPEVRAFLIAPISSPAHVYGWMCLVGNEGRPFSAEDEDLARALSGQVGRIYENGYFHSVAQKRAEELEAEVGERKRAELEVLHERDRARRDLDTAEVILLALDREGRIAMVNRFGCTLLGWTADELLGREWIETCIPPEIRGEIRQRFQALMGGDLSIVENAVLTRSGERPLIEWRNTVRRDEAGRVIGTFSSGTDITDRNRAAGALRLAEERMRFALESADVGIWDMDYRTGVLEWSATLEAHHGIRPGTFAGTFEAFAALIHPEDRPATLGTIDAAVRAGTDFSVHYRTVWPDGSVHWLDGAGRIHQGPEGRPVRGLGITLDTTARRDLEEQYRQAQKMEAIGRLAGGIAHDFNNLLTVILGTVELMLMELPPDDAGQKDLIEIQKAGTSAASLTRQLLAFSRKQILEPELIDLNVVISDMQPMLGRLIGEDVHVEARLEAGLAPVRADRGQVEQIIMNLAVNARDAMPSGGRLTLATANVDLDDDYASTHFATTPGAYVALMVTDSGIGMSEEVQARMFEPFFTTKEAGKGTGLGLATVHGIVAQSGGSVNVYSELGRGTTLKVFLPVADADEGVVAAASPAARPLPGEQTVLVVDDAKELRELASRLLQRQGYRVLVAANADEAMQLFDEDTTIDVILTDVVMPGASGPDLTRELMRRKPDLKVVYMSGYTEDAIVQHGVTSSGVAFLSKPFSSQTLGRKIREVLDA